MKAVILDSDSLGEGVDLSPIKNQVGELVCYPLTSPNQVDERIQNADVVITNKVVLNEQKCRLCKSVWPLATGKSLLYLPCLIRQRFNLRASVWLLSARVNLGKR